MLVFLGHNTLEEVVHFTSGPCPASPAIPPSSTLNHWWGSSEDKICRCSQPSVDYLKYSAHHCKRMSEERSRLEFTEVLFGMHSLSHVCLMSVVRPPARLRQAGQETNKGKTIWEMKSIPAQFVVWFQWSHYSIWAAHENWNIKLFTIQVATDIGGGLIWLDRCL